MDGKLTILALTHFGPEQATRVLSPLGFNANGYWRFFNDVLLTYKATDTLDPLPRRTGFGTATACVLRQDGQRVRRGPVCAYALTETLTLNGRAELGATTTTSSSRPSLPNSVVRFQQGLSTPGPAAPGTNTTYGALTLGVTWKPEMPVTDRLPCGSTGNSLGSRVHRQQAVQHIRRPTRRAQTTPLPSARTSC